MSQQPRAHQPACLHFAGVIALLYFLLGMAPAAYTAAAPRAKVAADAAQLTAVLTQGRTAQRCYVTDIGKGTQGTVVRGMTEQPLAPGRYRLHIPLAMAPLGDLNVSAIEITLSAGAAKRTLGMLHFTQPDEFTDFTLDFTAPGGPTPFAVSWSLDSEQAVKNRVKALDDVQIDPEKSDLGGEVEAEAPPTDEEGMISVADLPKLKYHLAACPACIETLPPLELACSTDKIVYQPAEKADATVTVTNVSDQPVKVALSLQVLNGLEGKREIPADTFELAADEKKSWQGPVELTGMHWGAELRAVARVGERQATASATFGVTDNFWETAQVTGILYSDIFEDPKVVEATMQKWRTSGFTVFESGFWAPDDFSDLTPDSEWFFSGQCNYRGTITATRNIINAAHRNGIAATVYAKMREVAGGPGFEFMRKHPDWVESGQFAADWLEELPLVYAKKILPTGLWAVAGINEGNCTGALDYHAHEMIGTRKQFGWDGVRYDTYLCDEWGKKAVAQVRAIVEQEAPQFRWGYNTFVPLDVKAGTIDVMLRGGQLSMEESVRSIGKSSSSFSAYLHTVMSYRDDVWAHGGHFGVCYDSPSARKGGSELDDLYCSTFLLASGSHPYYSPLESMAGQFAPFGLRYAEFIYNNRMRPVKAPEQVITIGGMAKPLEWQKLARALDLDDTHHRLVIHLINPPVDDLSLHNGGMKIPTPMRHLPVTLSLPADAKVLSAWNLTPIPTAQQTPLTCKQTGGTVTLTVPEVRFWNVLVIDYSAKSGLL